MKTSHLEQNAREAYLAARASGDDATAQRAAYWQARRTRIAGAISTAEQALAAAKQLARLVQGWERQERLDDEQRQEKRT